MKVVYVTNEYVELTQNFGGIAVVFKNEVDALIKNGFDVEVVLVANRLLSSIVPPNYMKVFSFPLKGIMKGIRGRFQLISFINRKYKKEDIIVVPDYSGLLPFWIKAAKIVQLHESLTLKSINQGKKINLTTYFMEYLNIISAKRIRAVSQSVLIDSRKYFPFIKGIESKVIHNGIFGFPEKVKNKNNSTYWAKNVIFIGKLSELKGVSFLGTIINGIHELLPETNFTVIGHDEIRNGQSQKEELTKSIRLISGVTFYERIENEKIEQFLNKSTVLILPSKTEALPMVVIEAFSCSVPVVAFNVGGVSEIIDDGINGFLIKPFEVNDFISKTCSILRRMPETINMPENAYRKFDSDFKLEPCIDKLEAFYASV